MTAEVITQAVRDALKRIAPEVDVSTLDPGALLRDEIDLDSMDFLNFVLALHARLGVDIPEADYAQLSTLAGATSYLAGRLGVEAR